MQFNETFVTGDIKYDFISFENEAHFREVIIFLIIFYFFQTTNIEMSTEIH